MGGVGRCQVRMALPISGNPHRVALKSMRALSSINRPKALVILAINAGPQGERSQTAYWVCTCLQAYNLST